jgi:hypothetical protein
MVADADSADAIDTDATDTDSPYAVEAAAEAAGVEAAAKPIDEERRRAVAAGQFAFEHIHVEGVGPSRASPSSARRPRRALSIHPPRQWRSADPC